MAFRDDSDGRYEVIERVRTSGLGMSRPDNRYQDYGNCRRCGKTVNVKSIVNGLCHACRTELERNAT